jgi:hypothetical protein
MTKKRLQSDRDAVQRLEDALIEDVLGASDEDIRAEARADGIDLERQAESMRSMFEREIVQAGKEKMAAARSGLAAYRSGSSQIVSPPSGFARPGTRRITEAQRLTMAARNASEQTERDLEGIEEDIAELKALQEEQEKKS